MIDPTAEQERKISELNDNWGVATWLDAGSGWPEGALRVTLDDGDEAIIDLQGHIITADWEVDPS